MQELFKYLGVSGCTLLSANLNILAQILMLVALWIGAYFARTKQIARHRRVQTTVVLVNILLILFVMMTSFYSFIIVGGTSGGIVAQFMMIHGILGLIAGLMGSYLLIRMFRSKWLPAALRVKNFKAVMRATLGLWTLLLAQHRARLLNAYAGLSEEQINTVADDTGWTLADVFAHVTIWEKRVSGLLPEILASDTPAVPTVNPDEFNRRAFDDNRQRGSAAVLDQLSAARRAMLATLAAASDEDINRERRLPSGKPFTVRTWAIQELSEHEAEHAEHVRLVRKARGARPSQDSKPLLAAGFAAAHDYLMTAAACVAAGQEATLPVTGGWTLRDVLGHIADWSFTIADAVDGALAGKALTEVEFNKLEEWSDAHTALRRADSWQKVKGDYVEAWRRVSAALDKVVEAQFGLPAARNERGPIALCAWLFSVPHHEEEHAGYLKDWVTQAS